MKKRTATLEKKHEQGQHGSTQKLLKNLHTNKSWIEIIAAQRVTGKVLDEREELAIVMCNVIIVHELLSIPYY